MTLNGYETLMNFAQKVAHTTDIQSISSDQKIISNHPMHNTYANFAKILGAPKNFAQELPNEKTNGCHQPERVLFTAKVNQRHHKDPSQ